jgi:DNA-directed RNA polymerase specialized sigma24 family protein
MHNEDKKNSPYKKELWLSKGLNELTNLDDVKHLLVYYDHIKTYAAMRIYAQNRDKFAQDAHDFALKCLATLILEFRNGRSIGKNKEEEKRFLNGIIANKLSEYYRAIKAEDKNIQTASDVFLTLYPPISNVEDEYIASKEKALKTLVDECMEELAQSEKDHIRNNIELIRIKYLSEKTNEELAEMIGTSLGGIKSRSKTGRELIRDCVEQKKRTFYELLMPFLMTNDFNYDLWEDQIRAFISDKMSATERAQFESKMAELPELKEAVELDKMIQSNAQEHALFNHLKDNWDTISGENKPMNEPNIPKIEKGGPLSIKAILGLFLGILVLISVYFFNENRKKEAAFNAIVSAYQKPLSIDNTNLNDVALESDKQALKAYTEGRFTDAEQLFLKADSKENNRNEGRGLYRAINAFMLQPPQSNTTIAILSERDSTAFRFDAVQWYLALAYLQKKDFKRTENLLKSISVSENDYASDAKNLLLLLNQNKFID